MMSKNSPTLEQGAKILQQHEDWLAAHLDELIDKYPGKIVAILNGEIVRIGDTYKEVYQPFLEADLEWMPLVVRVPHPDDLQELLI